MILHFPGFDVLRLALTSGAVPPAISLTPAQAGYQDPGQVWLQPSVALPRKVQTELRRLGVPLVKTSDVPLEEEIGCWPQALPVQPTGRAELQPGQAPVLFELADSTQLAVIVSEILRLGNDRQAFRWLEDGAGGRGLLRVFGPPYYSLLRALDRQGQADAPRAYVERAPRVWIEIGHGHPLAEQIKPPAGTMVLVRPPRLWTFLDEAPFRDIYEILEFALPQPGLSWRDVELERRLTIPLRLTRADSSDAPELWVLRGAELDQLDALVANADDQLLSRLAFAVGEHGGEQTIVLRARPSKLPPPVLVLAATAFRPYLKLPNLFLPAGTRLHPPLRRDAVRNLLAADADRVTWLAPHGDGTFTPESLPDQAFRPLQHWIDYVLDHDHVALAAWVEAARFDFEPFICSDDRPAKTEKPPARPRQHPEKRGANPEGQEPAAAPAAEEVPRPSRKKETAPFVQPLPAKISERQQRLRELEKQFLDSKSPLEAVERQGLWRDMALLNASLGNALDATLCWANSLWERQEPAPGEVEAWLEAETKGKAPDLEALLGLRQPAVSDLRMLAALLARAAFGSSPKAATARTAMAARLGPVQLFLETHEKHLPARANWLAWVSLAQLSQGDLLTLARARDRLLERLYQEGLSPDLDLPSFLRFSGKRAGERARTVRDHVLRLRDLAHRWIATTRLQGVHAEARLTSAYADLMFAFGLARLGEVAESQRLVQAAKDVLGPLDDVHTFLLEAFDFRIHQALEGKSISGPLPPEQIEYLGQMERDPRFKVDRLRENSRILEPHEKLDPYRLWTARYRDPLSQELSALVDVADRAELAGQLNQLLNPGPKVKRQPGDLPRILIKALELSPRIGEAFARELLPRVAPALEPVPGLEDRAVLLEQALLVAAHFDQAEQVRQFVDLFHRLLQAQRGTDTVPSVDALVGQCFRGLRKLGMRESIDRLLQDMADLVLKGQDLAAWSRAWNSGKQGLAAGSWLAAWKTLLQLAGGWFYFDRGDLALPVLDEVRDLLLHAELPAHEQKALACAYAATLGQAPVTLALPRLEEIFHTERIHDPFTTNTHYTLSKLVAVEAVVLALVSEDFALGNEVRRWLDDDEFLVRRRIHRDVRGLIAQAGL